MKAAERSVKVVARNKKAFHDYEIIERVVAGLQLVGSEVKSIRAGKINLAESYAQCTDGQVYIMHLHISSYDRAGMYLPDPARKRKLLLHKKEILRLSAEVDRKQLTLIPLSAYFDRQWVKIELGLCRGRKKYDKRQKIAEQESRRRIQVLMKEHRR